MTIDYYKQLESLYNAVWDTDSLGEAPKVYQEQKTIALTVYIHENRDHLAADLSKHNEHADLYRRIKTCIGFPSLHEKIQSVQKNAELLRLTATPDKLIKWLGDPPTVEQLLGTLEDLKREPAYASIVSNAAVAALKLQNPAQINSIFKERNMQLTALAHLINVNKIPLKDLNLSLNDLTFIAPLLDYVDCRDIAFEDDFIHNCSNAQHLILNSDKITYLSPPESLRTLECINCVALTSIHCAHHRELTEINLSHCNALQTIDCCYCDKLTLIDCSESPALTKLNCLGCNSLTSLACYNCATLQSIDCSLCKSLTELDLSYSQALQKLTCNNCENLTHLNCSCCQALTVLHCYNNDHLKHLNCSNCEALSEINCAMCPELEEMNFSYDQALETLICNSCAFKELDCSNYRALKTLMCDGCSYLEKLKLINCEALQKLLCFCCASLTEIDCSNCAALEMLSCTMCPRLETIISAGLPRCRRLNHSECPLLRQLPQLPAGVDVVSYNSIDFNSFEVDPEDLTNKPLDVLNHLGEAISKDKRMPNIVYLNSPGLDAGGLRRQLVTTLMQNQYPPEAYKTIGMLIALAALGSLPLGRSLNSGFYYALLNLEEDELNEKKIQSLALYGVPDEEIETVDHELTQQIFLAAKGFIEITDPKPFREMPLNDFVNRVAGLEVNWENFDKLATYTDPKIKGYFKTFFEKNPQKIHDVVELFTSSRALGVENIKVIVDDTLDKGSLFSMTTCFQQVKLPPYETYELFEEKLLKTIEHTLGHFGKE